MGSDKNDGVAQAEHGLGQSRWQGREQQTEENSRRSEDADDEQLEVGDLPVDMDLVSIS
jgi:hypothetical protein